MYASFLDTANWWQVSSRFFGESRQVDDKPWAFSEYLEKRRGVNDTELEQCGVGDSPKM